jgi:hypothetical protein
MLLSPSLMKPWCPPQVQLKQQHAAHGAADDAGALDAMIEQFVAQDELQWHAQHPYETIPTAQQVHRPSCLKQQSAQRGRKRVRWAEQIAPVHDAALRDKLILMTQTRAARKKCKQSNPTPVPPATQDGPRLAPTDDKSSTADAPADVAASNAAPAVPTSYTPHLLGSPAHKQPLHDDPDFPPVPWDDRQDRMLNPVIFLDVQSKVAVPFDLDAFARDDGTNALVSNYCSPSNSFYAMDLSNKQMLWINAPFDDIDSAMSYYFKNKGQGTGAVFLVPKAKASNPPAWVQYTKRMQLLHEFPRGMRLFTGPNPDNGSERHMLPPTWQDIQLWYDAPGVLPSHEHITIQLDAQPDTVFVKLRHKMQVPVMIAGIPTVALVDTGAQGLSTSDYVYVSEQFCKRQGLSVTGA